MLTVTIAHVGRSANSDLKGAGAVRTSFGLGNKSNRTAIIFVSQSVVPLPCNPLWLRLFVHVTCRHLSLLAGQLLTFLEFNPSLKRDHARGAVAANTDAEQPGWRRDGAFECAEPSWN